MSTAPDLTGGEALVASGLQIVKVEDDRMSSVAVLRPRDEKQVFDTALAELDEHPQLAAESYYSIPYKDHTKDPSTGCTRKADDNCPVKSRVEGIGIDGAQSLLRRWKNATATARIVGEDDESVHLEGVFIDLEHNTKVTRPFRVSKIKRYRSGDTYVLSEDKLAQAVGAGVSKVIRNAILSGIPGPLKRRYFEKAQALAASVTSEKIPELLEAFKTYKVDRAMLERYFGELEGLSGADYARLRGLFVGLRDGWTTVEQVFNAKDEGPSEPHPDSVDDVLAGGATESSRGNAPSPSDANPTPPASEPKPTEEPPREDEPPHPADADANGQRGWGF